jgi:iron complex transport system substrate-binding protein
MKMLFVLALFIFTSCGGKTVSDKNAIKVQGIEYAKHFSLIHRKDFVELIILNPENKQAEKKYALVKRGLEITIPADLTTIEIPLKSIVTLSGTHIGMMHKIGVSDFIKGVSSKKYVYNKTVLAGIEKGDVLEFEDFGLLNPERVLKTKSKVIVYSGFEGKAPANEDKLAKLGIWCMPNYDWREIHPLGKAEWVKLFGVLFDKEEAADDYFNDVVKQYTEMSESAKNLPNKPKVFSGMMYADTWYMPAGDSFGAKLLSDAGGDYSVADENKTGSAAFSFEAVLKNHQHTNFWFNVEFQTKKQLIQLNAKYRYFDAYKYNNIYTYASKMNQFWENSAVEPHFVLSDYIQIMHAGKVDKKRLHYYQKIEE